MATFSFLNKFKVLSESSGNNLESIFYPLKPKELEEVEKEVNILITNE